MKIQVIGAPGVGKSTLCEYISNKTGVYWIDTDRYLWKGQDYIEQNSLEERFRLYNLDKNNYRDYIVSGSVHSWYPEGFKDRELLVLLILDEEIRMKRLYDREFLRFGERMLPGGDHYHLTCEFLNWCKTYLSADEKAVNSLACHMRMLEEVDCKTLILDGNKSLDELCKCVLNAYWEKE